MKKNELVYYDLDDEIINRSLVQKDIIKSIKELDKSEYDKIFNMNKFYIQPFINYTKSVSNIGFRYTYKFFDGTKLSKGITVGANSGSGPGGVKELVNRFSKLDISEFKNMKEHFYKLSDDSISLENRYLIIQLVFRIKNFKSGHYVISNELNYLRLIK